MAIITKNQKWEDDYESDVEYGGNEEFDEKDDMDPNNFVGLFAPPQIFDDIENQNNWDILRIYTDIDEEVEYLEDNFMPQEMKWYKKKTKSLCIKKDWLLCCNE
eukprot:UN02366